jgi:hypothetical protein
MKEERKQTKGKEMKQSRPQTNKRRKKKKQTKGKEIKTSRP